MSTKKLDRARRYANGQTIKQIAQEDGVTYGAVQDSLQGMTYRAGTIAVPESLLPAGLEWVERTDPKFIARGGRWYVSVVRGGRITQDQMRWALAVIDGHADGQRNCDHCGRPL